VKAILSLGAASSQYDPDNTFARILRGELPCIKVLEDSETLAFMDIMPQVDGHVLVIPKEHAATLLELSPEGACACIRAVQRVARAVKQALQVPGVLIVQVNGAEVGQTVPHVHFHVMPRRSNEALRPHAAEREAPEKLEVFAQRIIAAL
jgi:histidine triad (HIT) family protein